MSKYIWTSEYVSPGHPDKIADQISDVVLDTYLSIDPNAKVACEVMVKDNDVFVAGEITSTADISEEKLTGIIRQTIYDIGYKTNDIGFNAFGCNIHFKVGKQSPEINIAVDKGEITTAGDQGIMFGYATRETPNAMPIPIYLAKKLIDISYGLIKTNYKDDDILRPDMKSQVSICFENGEAVSVDTVVLSMCHSKKVSLDKLKEIFYTIILPEVFNSIPYNLSQLFNSKTRYFINPAGVWNIGGPIADCGLTGRKIVVDQYGADCEIGGGAFSGKDPSKVDRSAAYMARHIAITTLHENPEANKIKVQLAYAIGEEYPVSYRIYDPTTGKEYGLGNFTEVDLTPSNIIERLKLKTPIYLQTAKKGHFGNIEFEWEKIGEVKRFN
jgi:S-adenosylmethionine synthetase